MDNIKAAQLCFGTTHQFVFNERNLTVKKRVWFQTKIVKSIPISDILAINYIRPKFSFIKVLLVIIFSPILVFLYISPLELFEGPYVEIEYLSNSEVAKSRYSSRVKKNALELMNSFVGNNK